MKDLEEDSFRNSNHVAQSWSPSVYLILLFLTLPLRRPVSLFNLSVFHGGVKTSHRSLHDDLSMNQRNSSSDTVLFSDASLLSTCRDYQSFHFFILLMKFRRQKGSLEGLHGFSLHGLNAEKRRKHKLQVSISFQT